MIELISRNPYRILGVYANASIKEITSNKTKLLAYTKVNKSLDYPCDCASLLGDVDRTEQSIANAEHELTLADNKLKFALFWFTSVH